MNHSALETTVATIERGWYAAQVRPKSEQYVMQLLAGKGYTPFVPMCQRRRQWSDRVVKQMVQLVPNYVFVHVTEGSPGLLVTTPRVIRIVGAPRCPWPIPDRPWVMTQSWHDLLFAHWSLDPAVVRALVPSELPLDLFDGLAWVGVIPFRMTNVAPR